MPKYNDFELDIQEFKQEDLLNFKAVGKQTSNDFTLCASCAEKCFTGETYCYL